jgi:hypothetical protein
MARRKAAKRIPKPWSEKTREEQIAEARGSIDRLRASINRNFDNRNIYDAIAGWEKTLARLEERG